MRVLALTLYMPIVSGLAYPQAADVRTGSAAFGDWQTDAPGVRRHIKPSDLGNGTIFRITRK